jgi:hypothetical protein
MTKAHGSARRAGVNVDAIAAAAVAGNASAFGEKTRSVPS